MPVGPNRGLTGILVDNYSGIGHIIRIDSVSLQLKYITWQLV
jgi:hypothetical protein